jgi:hypothetical protein
MKVPFKCSFCESEFIEFEEYNAHLSIHPTSQPEYPKVRLPWPMTRKELKCEICRFGWLEFTDEYTTRHVHLFSFKSKRLCSMCISEHETREFLKEKYREYFEKCKDMWGFRHKDLYVESYVEDMQCCLCKDMMSKYTEWGKRIVEWHYSLAGMASHRICPICFHKEMGNRELLKNCKCQNWFSMHNFTLALSNLSLRK